MSGKHSVGGIFENTLVTSKNTNFASKEKKNFISYLTISVIMKSLYFPFYLR